MYYYLFDQDLSHAVDLEVIEQRTNVPSETTNTRVHFRDELLKRDICCVWTGIEAEYSVGMHIIPFKRGSDVRSTVDMLPDRLPSLPL